MTHEPTADEATEDALVPVSALQHYIFCARQCALIHVEQLWVEDGATAEGRLLHERVDNGASGVRRGVRTLRGLPIRSLSLGVTGKADAVELHGAGPNARPYPVEYKRGRPKAHRADEVQLCAQAICLEEMYRKPVPEGALYYGERRRRVVVVFDRELRGLTARAARDVRAIIAAKATPVPVFTPACRRCSLVEMCRPKQLERPPRIARWLSDQVAD